MKKILLVVGVIFAAFIALIFYVTRPMPYHSTPVQAPEHPYIIVPYSNREFGLKFEYLSGMSRYELNESATMDPISGLLHTIVIARYEDVNNKLPIGSEAPPTITLQIFKNTEKQSSLAWAEKHIQYSNINLKTSAVTEVVVGGAPAIRYMADGLYASDNVVVAHGGYLYLMSGMFIDAESQLRKDFSPLVESIRFIPVQVTNGQGKLDINAICEGALAYMTFPDGKSADAFVAECKEGKHPEVIEQYKAQMGLGEGGAL